MPVIEHMDHYFQTMAEERMCRSARRLRFYQDTLFDGVAFEGKDVLDVGAGNGINGFYAACRGARAVLCLEPQADGSTVGAQDQFLRVRRRLHLQNVCFESERLQAFAFGEQRFDIILLHNSINHLDEPACIALLNSASAQQTYREIFAKLASLARRGGKLVLCDCSRYNLFATLGMRNPFTPDIAWQKHQAPQVWARLLAEVGFTNLTIRWSSFTRCGVPGRWLLGNRVMSYCLNSHFWMTMEKS